jgi:hypothetical protein
LCEVIADFAGFWSWLEMRRTSREFRDFLKYRSRLLDGSRVTFASLLDWDCDQLREFFFISRYAGAVVRPLVPYDCDQKELMPSIVANPGGSAENFRTLLAPDTGNAVDAVTKEYLHEFTRGRNIIGATPGLEKAQQFREDGSTYEARKALFGGTGHYESRARSGIAESGSPGVSWRRRSWRKMPIWAVALTALSWLPKLPPTVGGQL